jgi:NADPH-dependent curcumin reductase CurA
MPAEGEALLKTEYIGMDATMRSWLNSSDGYLPAVEVGDVLRASTVGTIVATNSADYEIGDVATSLTGALEYGIVRSDGFTTKVSGAAEMTDYFSVYGSPGMTAYIGTVDIGKVAEGETFVVSAAAGATGLLAGQIAKIKGARVVGIAGTPEKCSLVVDELGFDACINHRTDNMRDALKEHCPKGVNVYFDNVGGPILDAVLGRLAFQGRVALCGAISVYNDEHKPPGPANYLNLISRRGTMQGFIAFDHWGRYDEICDTLRTWVDDGQLRHFVDIYEGLESTVDALNALFTGANTGKVIVRP